MKRIILILVHIIIFSNLLASFATATGIEYGDNLTSITRWDNGGYGKAKLTRTVNTGTVHFSFIPRETVADFDSITFYLDISSYSDTNAARNGVVLPFVFYISSNGTNYRFKASLNKISGYSDGALTDNLTFTKNGAMGYSFSGFITLSASAFVDLKGNALSPNAEIDRFTMSVSPLAMSNYYFIMGDLYRVSNGNSSILFTFDDFFNDTEPLTEPSYTTQSTAFTTAVLTEESNTSVDSSNRKTTKASTKASTKIKENSKNYLSKPTADSDPTNTVVVTETLNTTITTQSNLTISNKSDEILPFAGIIISAVIISSAIIIVHHRKPGNITVEKSDANSKNKSREVKDEKL